MRWFRRVWNAVSTVLVLGVVLLAFLLVGVRLVGLTPYAVLSGSMEPTYHVGSLIYVGKIAPEEITVGDVLRTLEGGLNLVDCLLEEDACGKSCACPSRIVWLKIRDGLNRIVDGITLKDMMDDYKCLQAQGE